MYLAIDIGGTKTLIALLGSRGKILQTSRFATPLNQNTFFSTLVSEVTTQLPLKDLEAITVAVPGPTKNNQILWLGNLPWTNFPLAQKLHNLCSVPVYLENDASLAALVEAKRFRGTSIYLTFSTGIGGGIVRNGHLTPESNTFEPGHIRYPFGNQPTEWEDIASAQAISSHFGKLTHEIKTLTDWTKIAHRIAIGLIPIIRNLHPDRIIFGGPLGLTLKKYHKPLTKELSSSLSTPIPKLFSARHQHHSVIYGCYLYAKAQK